MEPEHAVAEHAAAGPLPAFNLLGWNLDLNDPAFWAFVGLIIFIGLILYMKVPGTVTKSLDDRATGSSTGGAGIAGCATPPAGRAASPWAAPPCLVSAPPRRARVTSTNGMSIMAKCPSPTT